MGEPLHHLIVGGNAAGVAAAFAMRRAGFDGTITIADTGTELPYERPVLSKALVGSGDVRPIAAAEKYAEQGVELLLGTRVAAIDPAAATARLDDGTTLPADRIVLATGVSARPLTVPGADLGGILSLRDVADARQLAAAIAAGGPLVVVGGGFIGLEVAAVARDAGCAVTVVELAPQLLGRVLPAPLADAVVEVHRAAGVQFRTGVTVESFRGDGTVSEVVLSSGERLPAAFAVVGVGVVPNDGLARDAGLRCDGGIVVDGCGRTSDPRVLAAGDVAVQPHPHLAAPGRIEHWDNAQQQGAAAGATAAGVPTVHEAAPYFWSEQYGLMLQMIGRPHPGDELVLRPDTGPRRFVAFWRRGEQVVAAAGLGAAREMAAARRIVGRGAEIPRELLIDPGADLRKLARA
ncbi:FAD-dependent oxidoreductase [Pseudonocardia kongjuensis]|uniref:FAD-dependent oxidoreductase n=1 Tax=Pseudonocardia kongjuensis TaxID=102227 RepID=A0ABN1XI64_9PSEU